MKALRCTAGLVLGVALAVPVAADDAATPTRGHRGSASHDIGSLRRMVWEVSEEHGLDPSLVDALVIAESGYNPYAVSRKGAMGLMQLMPDTARRLHVLDPFDPVQNVRGGVREFSRLMDRFGGDVVLALAAYNAGENAVVRHRGVPPYRETRGYVTRIMTRYNGKPFRLGERPARPQVRLVRSGSGEVVITNVRSASQTPPRAGGTLSGGFGSGR